MKKYKYEKFQRKNGRKSYIFSQHENDDWSGPAIEYFVKENITKIGMYSQDRKFEFEFDILNVDGVEYAIKACKKGYPNGPAIIMSHFALHIGMYSAKDGFNGYVYKLRAGENITLQYYRHGIMFEEHLFDYTCFDRVPIFPFRMPVSDNVKENTKGIHKVKVVDYFVGDDKGWYSGIASRVFPDGHIKIGQYSNGIFNGTVLEYLPDDNLYKICFYNDDEPVDDVVICFMPEIKGFSIMFKNEDGYTNYVYREIDGYQKMSIIELDAKKLPIDGKTIDLIDEYGRITKEIEAAPNSLFKRRPKKDESGKTALERLESMIGLANVKAEIAKLKAILNKNPDKTPILNMAFMGNPGTGKTEVARLFAEILYEEGILPSNKIVEASRGDLVADYIGQTEPKTHKLVDSAVGGVLFIDEAYNLKKDNDGKDFGQEAIDALMIDMDKYSGKMCFIFAGYKKPLLNMIKSNKGFKSRINRFFDFNDFDAAELKEIAKLRLEKDGYTMSDQVLDETIKIVCRTKYSDDFANAREVRNVLEKLYEYQAERTVNSGKRKDFEITMDDIDAYNKKDDPKTINNLTSEARLNNLIGLDSVKKEILKLKAILIKNKDDIDNTNLHMCFYGNPGTGKTEVARLLANILYDEGILPENKFIETDRSGLVAEYVGQTAIKTHNVVKDALGGVLFIDEAYSLANDSSSGFCKEAVDALVTDMENFRGKFCVILAGYEEEMDALFSMNTGFKSRINRNIVFPDYTDKELLEIAKSMIKGKNYTITDDALVELEKVFAYERNQKDFANARTVRNVLESIYEIQALRTYEEGISDSRLLKLVDVEEYKKDHSISFEQKKVAKNNFNVKVQDIMGLANCYNSREFIFSIDAIKQASVNIKIEKEGKIKGEGSGFFISPSGIIATCAHVVKNADRITVIVNIKTANNQFLTKDYAAEVIAYNEEDDVAIIGLLGANFNFVYYPLELNDKPCPKLMTEIVMGGYPFGGDRFESISITEGKVQSVNKDHKSGKDNENIYVDLSGHPGGSGSGVIDKQTGRCIGIFGGCAIAESNGLKRTMNYAIPTRYLWKLLEGLETYKNTLQESGIKK